MYKKIMYVLSFLALLVMVFGINQIMYADVVTSIEENAFIVRDEFDNWQTSFLSSLSELDGKAKKQIYAKLSMYDLQFSLTYKATHPSTGTSGSGS